MMGGLLRMLQLQSRGPDVIESATETRTTQMAAMTMARRFKQRLPKESDQLLGGNSTGVFCLPVPNSKIFRSTPGAIAEIGLTRSTGWPGVPTTS
jgi:hypothetical protein